jgi:hypothetical protein
MKQLLVAICIALPLLAFAGHGHGHGHEGMEMMKDPAKWQEHKTKMLAHLEEKIASMTKTKECVTAAQSHEALKACHEQMKMDHHK